MFDALLAGLIPLVPEEITAFEREFVEAAQEVASLAVSDIRPAPQAALASEMAVAFEGVANYGERLIILLDADKALPKPAFVSAGVSQEADPDV